jgi:hypothetical protein
MRNSSRWFGLIALASAACGGEFFGLEGDPVETPDAGPPAIDAAPDLAAIARAKFDSDVAPIMPTCLACHNSMAPGAGAPGFMVQADLYVSIMASGYVVPGDPNASILVTYPTPSTLHPIKLTTAQSDAIKGWIDIEPRPGEDPTDGQPTPLTPKIAVVAGANEFDLTLVNPLLVGAKMTFQLEMLSGGTTWFVSQIKVKAGPEMGVEVDTPLLTWWDTTVMPNDPNPDPVSSLSGMKVSVAKGAEIDLGTVVLVDVKPSSMLSFTFKKLATYNGTPGGGVQNNINCKQVASFLTNARPPIQTSCATAACHGGMGTAANSAWNLNNLGSADATVQATLCATVKSKLNLANAGAMIDMSIMFQRPDPAIATHPFKFPGATEVNNFRNAVKLWGTQEI